MSQDRRNDYDVTDTVQVSDFAAVRDAVRSLFDTAFPQASFDILWLASYDVDRLFEGRFPGYLGCDTTYHDKQHTLDMTLAVARLIAGYEKTAAVDEKLGAARAQMAIITSLFHDSGYIRHAERDRDFSNGAVFTLQHVSRSADFLRSYLPGLGLAHDVAVSSVIVHFTGYEIDIDGIELDDPKDAICGHFLGTADLIAQLADRCYLEKCRDRLYKEFVLGGIAIEQTEHGNFSVRYESGIDLLKKTPTFYEQVSRERLQEKFNRAYRYIETLYDGQNPYVAAIRSNLKHLMKVLKSDDWDLLRRNPPLFVCSSDTPDEVDDLVASLLAALPADHATTKQAVMA